MDFSENVFGVKYIADDLRTQLRQRAFVYPFYLRLVVDTIVVKRLPYADDWVDFRIELKSFGVLPQDPNIPEKTLYLDDDSETVVAVAGDFEADVAAANGGAMTDRYGSEILVLDESALDGCLNMLLKSFERNLYRHCIKGLENPTDRVLARKV